MNKNVNVGNIVYYGKTRMQIYIRHDGLNWIDWFLHLIYLQIC